MSYLIARGEGWGLGSGFRHGDEKRSTLIAHQTRNQICVSLPVMCELLTSLPSVGLTIYEITKDGMYTACVSDTHIVRHIVTLICGQ
jgi:hypothetical protein